jgi:ParB family chromosome partitioning protein
VTLRVRQLRKLQISDMAFTLTDLELNSLKQPSWKLRPIKWELVKELERSIEGNGLLQPIVVRRVGNEYEIVFGNHRVEACKRLGMRYIRAIIKEFTEEEAFLARATENIVRNSYVDPIEEAEGYRMLIRKGWTIDAIGQRVGKCDSYVCERLAMLERLDQRILSRLAAGKLGASHAELIARIADRERQNEVAELVEKKHLSVRSLEDLLKRAPAPTKVPVETISDETYVRIPKEFLTAIGVSADATASLFLYVRGKKLILQNLYKSRTYDKVS